jgi:tetratricopeptide (TPR) repeat protein
LAGVPGAFANSKSRIIVTTREAMLTGFVLEVSPLAPVETAEFIEVTAGAIMLRHEVPEGLRAKQIDHIVRATGGNPQAVLLALGLINSTGDAEIVGQIFASPRGSRPIRAVLLELATALLERLDRNARLVIGIMLGFSPEQPLPEAPLRRGTTLEHRAFSTAVERTVRSGLLERNGADGTLTMRTIPHELLLVLQDQFDVPRAPLHSIAQELLEMLKAPDMICRTEIKVPYWNALVRPEMARVDPLWPLLRQVMAEFQEDIMLVEFVFLLAHYMDNRLHNAERVQFVRAAIAVLEKAEADGATNIPGLPPFNECIALLRIDALAWTYIEEQQPQKAREEITKARKALLSTAPRCDLEALADAWQARMCAEAGDYVNAEECIRKAMGSACQCLPDAKWILMRVHMIKGDVRMFQHRAAEALEAYRDAEHCAETYGGEGNAYQTSPRIGLALLENSSDQKAEEHAKRLFQNLAHQHDLSLGQLYGEYGLAVIAARKRATVEAQKRLHKVYQEICLHTNSNVLLRLARRELEAIGSTGMRNQRRTSDRIPSCH